MHVLNFAICTAMWYKVDNLINVRWQTLYSTRKNSRLSVQYVDKTNLKLLHHNILQKSMQPERRRSNLLPRRIQLTKPRHTRHGRLYSDMDTDTSCTTSHRNLTTTTSYTLLNSHKRTNSFLHLLIGNELVES